MIYNRFKRVSISTAGDTVSILMSAKNISEALEQELDYYTVRDIIPAQINITVEDKI